MAVVELSQLVPRLGFQLLLLLNLLLGLLYFLWRWHPRAKPLIRGVSILVLPNQMFDVQVVLVHEGRPLIHKTVLGVEDLGVPGIDDVLDDVSELVHLGLCVILLLIAQLAEFDFLLVFLSLLAIFPHHVLFTYLIEAIAHSCELLILELLKLLQLNKLDVLDRTLRRLFHLIVDHLWKYWVRRNEIFLWLYYNLWRRFQLC